ncbi:MAG: alanine racemase [Clostridia bacterium]|nr:alanine racemase [Clostridia bacterium]
MCERRYPILEVNLDAMRTNARVLCNLCKKEGISVAGVIKFSDGNLEVAKAYADGGCAQIAVSRAKHLKSIKEAIPGVKTFLTRSPNVCDLDDIAQYADFSLHSDKNALIALNEVAGKYDTHPGVILMLDVGDLREGVDNIDELVDLAILSESLPNIELCGVGTNHACLNGVLPTFENLTFLVEGAEAVEKAIGRRLDIISGGSTINLLLLKDGINRMPGRINHLRLGGSIANPMTMRLGRGLCFDGLREDSVRIVAQIVEIHEKASMPKGESTKNWAGKTVTQVDKGRRIRAILAIGSQDIMDAGTMIPLDNGVEIVGCSSDHTIVDVTDADREFKWGDTLSFKVRYSNMLYAFSGDHVTVEFVK